MTSIERRQEETSIDNVSNSDHPNATSIIEERRRVSTLMVTTWPPRAAKCRAAFPCLSTSLIVDASFSSKAATTLKGKDSILLLFILNI